MSDAALIEVAKCPERLLPARIVLSRTAESNTYQGVIENSFSMGRAADRVLICWSLPSTSSSLLNTLAGKTINLRVNGVAQAEDLAKRLQQAGETLEVWDVNDPALPVEIDWAAWEKDNEPYEGTLSGVRDKYRARNAPFAMREQS
jgi:hypothetical protein